MAGPDPAIQRRGDLDDRLKAGHEEWEEEQAMNYQSGSEQVLLF